MNYNKDLTRQSYLVFLNSEKFKNYQSFVGLGLRELVNDEFTQYCLNKIKPIKPPYFIQQQNSNRYLLTSDFYFLAYLV